MKTRKIAVKNGDKVQFLVNAEKVVGKVVQLYNGLWIETRGNQLWDIDEVKFVKL